MGGGGGGGEEGECIISGLLVPIKFTVPSGLTKQRGVVPDMVDRWHNLVFRYLKV